MLEKDLQNQLRDSSYLIKHQLAFLKEYFEAKDNLDWVDTKTYDILLKHIMDLFSMTIRAKTDAEVYARYRSDTFRKV